MIYAFNIIKGRTVRRIYDGKLFKVVNVLKSNREPVFTVMEYGFESAKRADCFEFV